MENRTRTLGPWGAGSPPVTFRKSGWVGEVSGREGQACPLQEGSHRRNLSHLGLVPFLALGESQQVWRRGQRPGPLLRDHVAPAQSGPVPSPLSCPNSVCSFHRRALSPNTSTRKENHLESKMPQNRNAQRSLVTRNILVRTSHWHVPAGLGAIHQDTGKTGNMFKKKDTPFPF